MARRNHKERAQPLNRKRLGHLEKHKDYVHRARDYNSKQARLRTLREKAAFRNKDEFYWGMVKGRTKDGVAIGDRGNVALSADTVKLLKTQDVRYIRLQLAKDQKVSARHDMYLGDTDDRKRRSSSVRSSRRCRRPAQMGGMLGWSWKRSNG
jgi:U3 small nucleolar RNA-associated protein 11